MIRTLALLALLLAAAPALAKPPSWDRKIDSPKRFKVLKPFDSQAVLDQETGLVWAREPSIAGWQFNEASQICANLELGGRGGWRLPAVQEMRSLIGPVTQALPDGHPFTAPDGLYWTGTFTSPTSSFVWLGDLGAPESITYSVDSGSGMASAWCVRRGLGAD